MVPKAWSPEPTETLPQSLPCLAADLLSSFLLIGVLFAISISLLYGVVKVRLVQGWRGQEQMPSCCPEYPTDLQMSIWEIFRATPESVSFQYLFRCELQGAGPGYQGGFGVAGYSQEICILWTMSRVGSFEIKEGDNSVEYREMIISP